ncbi:molybdopterin-guanine dinucleotide biosynthesis protein B [Bacteroidota bacterium]
MKIGSPVQIHIVGFKKTGKTSLVEFIINSLIKKGYQVGGFKHSIHIHPLDKPNTDTDRARQAGANPTVFYTPEGISAVFTGDQKEYQQIFDVLYKDCHYIVVESFRKNEGPKIVTAHPELNLNEIENIYAVITPDGKHESYPAFQPDDPALIDFILEKFPAGLKK